MSGLQFTLGKGFILLILLSVITTISPFSISLINFAPIISKEHVSEVNIGDPSNSP